MDTMAGEILGKRMLAQLTRIDGLPLLLGESVSEGRKLEHPNPRSSHDDSFYGIPVRLIHGSENFC